MSETTGVIGIFLGTLIVIFSLFTCLGLSIFGIILIIAGIFDYYKAKEKEEKIKKSEKTKDRYCPNCGRNIPFDARMCPYCGKKFENDIPMNDNVKTQKFVEEIEKVKEEKEAERDKVETIQEEKKMKICPSCRYENKPNSIFCKKCGAKLDD